MLAILRPLNAALVLSIVINLAAPQQAVAFDVCIDGGIDPDGNTYEDSSCIHEDMAEYGVNVHHNHDALEYDDLTEYTDDIRYGAGHEDQVDHIYGETGTSVTVGHFWDPDPGGVFNPNKLNTLDGIGFFLGDLPNSWQKSQAYWSRALGEYVAGNYADEFLPLGSTRLVTKAGAYHFLGHVVHHMGDNTIPTHVSVISHAPWGRDSYENWMSNKYHRQCTIVQNISGVCALDDIDYRLEYSPPTYHHKLSFAEEDALYANFSPYEPKLGRIDPLAYADLDFDIPEVDGVETPYQKLFWLLYTTNQIAEFFAADRNNAGVSDGEGEANDPTGWAQGDLEKMADPAAGLRPRTVAQMSDDDSCDCDAEPYKDLSSIREYSYLRGIRAIGGLFNLFEQTVKTKPLISIDVSALNVALPNGTCNDGILSIRDACDLFARVIFSDVSSTATPVIMLPSLFAENFGDRKLNQDNLYTPDWRWGRAVEDSGFIRILLQVWDDDDAPFTDVPVRITPESPDSSGGGKALNLLVDLSKCLRGEPGAITAMNFIGQAISGQIGTSLCNQSQATSVSGNESENDGIVKVSFSIRMVEFQPPVISCAEVDDVWHADNVTVACTASDSGVGLAVPSQGTFSLTTTVSNGAETASAFTNSLPPICDKSTNCADAGPIGAYKIDRKPPQLTAPGSLTIEATGPATSVDVGTASATDLSGIASLSNDAPASFPVGTTIVTWTATDGVGRVSTAQQSVIVADTTPPVLTPPPDVKITAGKEGQNIGTATATDAVGVKFISDDAPNRFSQGRTRVTWYAIDDAGNVSSAIQYVTASKKGGGAFGIGEFLLLFLFVAMRWRYGGRLGKA
jgi:hypothetical protein